MDLKFSQEQQMLEDTVARFVQERYDIKQRDEYLAEQAGYSKANWQTLAQMGLLGLLAPESEGGFAGGPAETMIVMKALGRGLVVEPFWSSIILAGALAEGHELRAAITGARTLVAPALYEPTLRYDLDRLQTTVDGIRISGTKSLVFAADSADGFIVAACAGGRGTEAVGLYLVPASTVGITARAYQAQDGTRAAEVQFDAAEASECICEPGKAWPVIERAVDWAVAALCAEYVGVAEVAFELTHDYLQTREQFGRPIGRFQVLQHALTDMRIAVEEASAMALSAARDAGLEDAAARARGISAAKSRIGEASRFIAQTAIQLHGGMGMTQEHAIGRYAKRLTVLDFLLGDADYHAERFSRLMVV